MTSLFEMLSDGDLREIAAALQAGRLAPPFTQASVQRFCSSHVGNAVGEELQQLLQGGFAVAQLGLMLNTLGTERAKYRAARDSVELVCTGPEAPGVPNRDTGAVVRELFSKAEKNVLVVGYAVYQGREIFQALADRMKALPALPVTMFLDVQRPHTDTSQDSEILRRFATRFKGREWPGERLPSVFYDPRSLDMGGSRKSCLHAKCVVVDRAFAFVSSANFTQAAQQRNIEVGVLIESPRLATEITEHFEALAAASVLRAVPGLP
jgi:phosphatidylserine/phosphatidylglycerophosphate/cardiolipin synthase-like enzyme